MMLNRHIQEYIDIVEKAEFPVCKEQILLIRHVKKCFETEEIYVDDEQLEKYLALQKYFNFKLFEWEKFCFLLHNCTYIKPGILRWPDLVIIVGRGAGKNGYLSFEDFALLTPVTIDSIRLHIVADRTVDNSFNIQIEQNNKSTVWADPDNFASATIKDEYVKNKADKAETLAGYGITDGVSTEIFDYLSTQNLADIADTSVSKLGVNVKSVDNLITLSGTSNATGYIYLPLKSPISLKAGTKYTLSLQNFTTKNTGCVIYPCNGETVINSSWLLSEGSGLNGNVSTFTATENVEVNSIRIHCATGSTVDNSFNIQIEEGSTSTAYPVLYAIQDVRRSNQ